MMEQKIEKRKLDRVPFSYPVLYEINSTNSDPSNTIRGEGYGLDVSSSGIGILTDRLMSPGDVVKLYIPLGSTNTIIPTSSEVRWIEIKGGRCRLGLKFLF
jgi:hypothetical protein